MRSACRLRASADFERVRRDGHSLAHPLLVLAALPNGLLHSRFGFAVGRRLGKAAERNRLKRRLREAIRLRLAQGQLAGGYDVVFIARAPLRDATYRQLDQAVELLLQRADLLTKMP